MHHAERILKLPRSYFDSPTWKSQKEFTEATAELDLIRRAMYTATSHLKHGVCLSLHPGELVASVRDLATDWKWSRGKVERFLKNLTKMGHIGTRTETGVTVRFLNKNKYPEFFCASDRDTNEAKDEASHGDADGSAINYIEHRFKKNGEPKNMSASRSNDRSAPTSTAAGPHRNGSSARSAVAQPQAVQWNRERFPTLAHLRRGLRQMKENDQLHLNDRMDLFDLLREILGDDYVNKWQHCWEQRWRAAANRVRQAVNGLIDDLLNRPPEHGIKNPAGHLNNIWQRLTIAQTANDQLKHSSV